jgi:hypothetical protein
MTPGPSRSRTCGRPARPWRRRHHDPGFTLRTYTHLMPSSEGRARKAVDRALRGGTTPDGTLTEHASDV